MRKLAVQRGLTRVRGGYTILKSLEDTEYPLDKGKKFRLLDHTADLGILVYGRDLEELFSNAGEAFFDIITDLRRVREDTEKTIRVESSSLEDLMVNWLGELLYLHDVDGLLFKSFSIDELNGGKMKARARGEAFQEERHVIKTEIKAVTYHQLQVKEERGGWMARIIFDV
jgi:SHS2 domain-containing protein